MNNRRLAIPYLFTISNLLCGFLSVFCALNGRLIEASWLIILAGLMDGLDGKIARFTGSSTRLGVEFDSMADLVSFGIAPGILMYKGPFHSIGPWGWGLAFLYVASGSFRLARFNYLFKGYREEFFRGMPITMAGMTLASQIIFFEAVNISAESSLAPAILTVVLVLLMVSTIPYESLPSFHLETRREKRKAFVLLICAAMIAVKPSFMVFFCMIGYLVIGPIRLILSAAERKPANESNQNHHSARHE